MTYIVEEPDDADNEQTETVELDDQDPGGLLAHRLLSKLLGFLEAKTKDEENERKDDTNSETCSPDSTGVTVVAGGGNDI